jgi:hypothetical protein
MEVLIVDDSQHDRKVLRQMIRRNFPEYNVQEAKDISEMYSKICYCCDFLFQDIALTSSEEPDSEGLIALYDVIDSFPELPITIITGHFSDKVREFHKGFLGKTRQVIDFLDKLVYGSEDIIRVFMKAADFKVEVEKEKKEKLEVEELLEDMLNNEEERIQLKIEALREQSPANDNIYERAFSGNDWACRIDAESEITSEDCNQSALLLCIEIERLIKILFQGRKEESPTFYKKAFWIREKHGLDEGKFKSIINANSVRNGIVHARTRATKSEALALADCLRILQNIHHKKRINRRYGRHS